MTLKAAIEAANRAAMAAMDGVEGVDEAVVVQEVGAVTQNTDTGVATYPILSTHPFQGKFSSYKEEEIDGNEVKREDKRLTIENTRSGDLYLIKTHDYVLDSSGRRWQVMSFKRPVSTLQILQVRVT